MLQKQILLSIFIAFFWLSVNHLLAQNKENLNGIEIGMTAPDIELPNVEGDMIKLSQFKGKMVLINYWASWCAPCRRKIPKLLEIYNTYKNIEFEEGETGLEIFSISLDKNEIAWKNTIEKDSIGDFVNVGDMKAWKSPAALSYSVKTIPSSVLVNGKGKVIAVNLKIKDLNRKMKKLKKTTGWLWF